MRIIILVLLTLILSVLSSAQPVQKCFRNIGLKDEHRIAITIDGREVSGEMAVIRDYEESPTQSYLFTGTLSKNSISVKFADGKIPDVFPKIGSRLAFTLVTKGDSESLIVKLSTLRHDRGWFEVYSAIYESCEPSYGKIAAVAKRVAFKKGKRSTTAAVKFTTMNDRQGFFLSLRKGQQLSVSAPGCGISFFYPDKTKYEEGTAIDTWSNDRLTQGGEYLFVILPAGQPGACDVKFKTK